MGTLAVMVEPFEETRHTYDAIAPEYARRNAAAYPQLLGDVANFVAGLAPGSLVADVGCGPGRDIAVLREHGLRVIGFDLSVGQLRAGRETADNTPSDVAQADMACLPVRTSSVDGLWCQAALLHIPRRRLPAVIGEFGRVLRKGGQAYLAVAEGDGEGWEVASVYGSRRRRWFTFHREPDLTGQLAAAGFQVHQVRRSRSNRDWLALHARRAG